ncbi:5-oxoprolinase subunit PxpA [Flammeovirga kamogawensis]|uniref:5-oxoprolinase subunit PxpA n=1 Tax=Flammeovirga kamogawensis TaxID=373891 RepID=A0ABX8GS83_9BACT|nr:5-oxoprolinase subunit PxpA [Flammeovirga kamogawensis]MBB6462916.1 UPF0271 protein [Flammeovirga kamogawensis]QWG06445.1 5-oxoprolinase subunit PxpA [Flammeovirga kamogawensis]TRX68276.1 5-oxoprolinase subunit PxpA [Flammeovirga kamogawensis]
MKSIDLNADLGEGFPYDERLLKLVSSCNIACGGHAGDESSMASTISLAKKYNVTIGAHPSYPDKGNFGRKMMEISSTHLITSLTAQINQLLTIGIANNATIHYIKPHGALYNKAMNDKKTATSIITSVKEINKNLAIMGMPNSELEQLCSKENIPFIKEGFADRRYTKEGLLVSRNKPNAVLHKNEDVWNQVVKMIQHQEIDSEEGVPVSIITDSICFHGDTPEALTLLQFVSKKLNEHSIEITSF